MTYLIITGLALYSVIIFLLGIQFGRKNQEKVEKGLSISKEAAERLQKRYEHRMDEIHK